MRTSAENHKKLMFILLNVKRPLGGLPADVLASLLIGRFLQVTYKELKARGNSYLFVNNIILRKSPVKPNTAFRPDLENREK